MTSTPHNAPAQTSCARHRPLASFLLVLALLVPALLAATARAQQQDSNGNSVVEHAMGDMSEPMTANMAAHMKLTSLQPIQPGDRARAAAVVVAARQAMAPYRDYRKALDDGYQIFMPNLKGQKVYHFTSYDNAQLAQSEFDPLKPTSLLYEKTANGGYKLVGAMYTDRVNASLDELNQRIPLSVARWHQHVNFCVTYPDSNTSASGRRPRFKLIRNITTQQACQAVGGTFRPHLFGWMVHVYPDEANPRKIWALEPPGPTPSGHGSEGK